jgi:cell filamentation protein
MSRPKSVKPLLQEERDRIEGLYTAHRIFELKLAPVRGSFDAAHLKEINFRIFQDMPGAGFDDVTPGEYRQPVPEGKDWVKNRGLSTVAGPFHVAYSRMDETAQARLDQALEIADPDELGKLNKTVFTARFGKLYAELDYLHPFSDGNSRTLREFMKQLASQSGYELDWDRFNTSEAGRDVLYIARGLSVNALAKPHIQHEETLRKIIHSMDRLEGNRSLPDLLRDAICSRQG